MTDDRFRLLVESMRDYAVFMLDLDGVIQSWNCGAEIISGYPADEIIGQHFSRFYPAEEIERGWPEHELAVARDQGRYEEESWRLRKDGVRFWANVVITPLRTPDGALLGYSKIMRDLSERKRNEEVLRQSEERLRLFTECVKDYAIFMLDNEGFIISWNAGAQHIKGYSADEIIGKHFSTFYPPDAIARGWPQHELTLASTQGRFEDEGWRLRKDGTRFWANVIITALRGPDGKLRGFSKITRDLTERKRTEALQESGDRIQLFLAMLAHELRNPLAPIRNAVSVMQMHPMQDPRLSWARDVVDRQVNQLTRLVDELLDASRLTSGKIFLLREPREISAVVAHAVESCRPLIESRQQHLEIDLPQAPLWVCADMTRLSQALLNLLNNASKYTPEGGHITLKALQEGSDVALIVRDTGVGISAELLPAIFELFVQGDASLDRKNGGLGVGLTLVKAIASMHGGSVSAASAGLNQGSEFTLRVPMMVRKEEAAAPPPAAKAPLAPVRHRILVVDDNLDSAETMTMLLRFSGHEVRLAYDGPSALSAAREMKPAVVLLDLGLPGMSGFEVAQHIQAMNLPRRPVLVAMTGYGQQEDRQRSAAAGFDHHLVKPVDFDALAQILGSIKARAA